MGSGCRFSHFFSWMLNSMAGAAGGLCTDYIAGFCPKGPNCKYKHLKSVIIDDKTSLKELANFPDCENYATAITSPFYK